MVLDRKIAFIDLKDGSIEINPVSSDLRTRFLGGRGLNMYFLSNAYSSDLDPFSSENPLIFGAGLLTGTLGYGEVFDPGDRSFFLQARDVGDPVTVSCEKEQASVLAEKVLELLDQVRRSGVDVSQEVDEALVDVEPLDQPIEPEFTVMSMGILKIG